MEKATMRRSDVINHAYAERLEEELVKAKGMTRNALQKAYAEKAALLSLGAARMEFGDNPLALNLHRRGEIAGKYEGRRSARSESASHAARANRGKPRASRYKPQYEEWLAAAKAAAIDHPDGTRTARSRKVTDALVKCAPTVPRRTLAKYVGTNWRKIAGPSRSR
jgi:hypothetical protein